MKLQRTHAFHPFWLFLAPVASVALILMFLSLLCTPLLLQPGITVQVPSSNFLLPPQREPLIISITGPPIPTIFFDNQQGDLKKLDDWLVSQQSNPSRRTVIIKSDQYTPTGIVTEVLNQALRRGYSTVLATEEKSGNK